MDLMIAATALSLGVVLVTRNPADVDGDEIIWYGGQGHSIIWRPFGHLPTRHRRWPGAAGWCVRDDRHAS
jgi:hypothetical protein